MKTEIYGEKKSDKNKQINTATAKTDQSITMRKFKYSTNVSLESNKEKREQKGRSNTGTENGEIFAKKKKKKTSKHRFKLRIT